MKEDHTNNTTPDEEYTEDEDMFVSLELDDGTSVESRILTIFDAGEQDYIVLLPLDEQGRDNPDGEVYIYRYFEDKAGNPYLENIKDDTEYEVVSNRFEELLDSDFL